MWSTARGKTPTICRDLFDMLLFPQCLLLSVMCNNKPLIYPISVIVGLHQKSFNFFVICYVFYFSPSYFLFSSVFCRLHSLKIQPNPILNAFLRYLFSVCKAQLLPVYVSGILQDSTVLIFHLNSPLQVPSEKILRVGKILRNAILSRAPHMIRDRKYHLKTYR